MKNEEDSMEPVSPITPVIGAASGLAQRLLGPTCDYLGEKARDLVKQRLENFERIIENGAQKASDVLDEPGVVPPRVLKAIVDEGSYCENELFVDSYGGVLASSRTGTGRDDRGATLAKALEGMSVYQLRAHYLLYSTIREKFKGSEFAFDGPGRCRMRLFVSSGASAAAFDFSSDEMRNGPEISTHMMSGLESRGFLGTWRSGRMQELRTYLPDKVMSERITDSGLIFEPSHLGAELYAWAAGWGQSSLRCVLDPTVGDFLIPGVAPYIADAIWIPQRSNSEIAKKLFE